MECQKGLDFPSKKSMIKKGGNRIKQQGGGSKPNISIIALSINGINTQTKKRTC